METEFMSFNKIIIFGSKGAGKTTLIKKMKSRINTKNEHLDEGKIEIYNISF